MSSVLDATRETYDEAIAGEGWVLVDFWGPQCRPCLVLAPHVEELAERLPDLRVVKVEAPKARRLCIDLRVMGLPTFLLYRDGEEVARLTDPDLSVKALDEWLEGHRATG